MTFWLDDPGRRPACRAGEDLERDRPDDTPEQAEPALVHVTPPKRGRRPRPARLLIATGAAAGLHAGLAMLLVWSASKTKLDLKPQADTAAMFASLTPASSISPQPSPQPPSPVSAVETVSDAARPPSQTLAPTHDEPPPETNTAPAVQSAEIDQALINTSQPASVNITPVHEDTDNPWAHASVRMPVLSTGEKLWAAVKPCLHDSLKGPFPIRMVLDDHGRLQRTTDIEGGDAQANPQIQALAVAAAACAPYDRVVTSPGSYLIIPSG